MGYRLPACCFAFLWSAASVYADQMDFPRLLSLDNDSAEFTLDGTAKAVAIGGSVGKWAFMGITGDRQAVLEDFSTIRGRILLLDEKGHHAELKKSAEATYADSAKLYLGHTLKEVMESDHDLLGRLLLAGGKDPDYDVVEACLAPITKMDTYTFVATRATADKVGVSYGGRTANFDPAALIPEIGKIRSAGKVLDGLIGGWLPVLRFVYPESEGTWSEMVAFAPLHLDNENPRIQPVWYRVCRIEDNRLKWTKTIDSANPFPPRAQFSANAFWTDLLALRKGYEETLAPAMNVDVPDQRLMDMAHHSLIRSMITRIGSYPKYGVMDRNYGGSEHDGFQDTFNSETTALIEWGLFDLARDAIDNYFGRFVRDDGSILYRGPQTGQYGRMLTVVAEYYSHTGDADLLLKYRKRIDAVANLLLNLRREAQKLPQEAAAHGMIAGWCEADSCLEEDPTRYMQPYLSNSAEAARGFGDLGKAWSAIGKSKSLSDVAKWGTTLREESKSLREDLNRSIEKSTLRNVQPPSIPSIAGALEPYDAAARRDAHDPQFRAYRTYMEMLFSGCLTTEQVNTIVDYREAHRDILAGVPAAYGYNSGEIAGFLSYGHAYGLLQHDRIPDFLLELYSLCAHQYTRGSWTAPETRRLDPLAQAAPYCVPAQVAEPMLLRWMLAFEDPNSETLWLCKGTPRVWLEDGKSFACSSIPTRWGKVGYRIQSHLREGRIDAEVDLPVGVDTVILRLRTPGQRRIKMVTVDGKLWTHFDPEMETVELGGSGKLSVAVNY